MTAEAFQVRKSHPGLDGDELEDVAEPRTMKETAAEDGSVPPPLSDLRYVMFCSACASLNSLNLGYDIGVSGGAFFVAQDVLSLTEFETELIVGSLNVWAVLGAVFSRTISDAFGRTRTLAVGSCLFCVGSLVLASSSTFSMLMLGRTLLGLGVGAGLSIDPLYISEISPQQYRGFLVSWSELAINLGIIGGFLSSYGLSGMDANVSWRLMVGLGAVMPLPMLMLSLLVMPESPRYLVRIGADQRAAEVLGRLMNCGASARVDEMVGEIKQSIALDRAAELGGWAVIWSAPPAVRRMLTLVVTVAIAQHACGVEAFMYYTPFLLRDVGFRQAADVLGITAAMGVVKTAALAPVAWALDQEWGGRRFMLLVSYAGMAVALLFLAVGIATHDRTLLLASIFGYVVLFSVGAGPVCWLLASEVLPTELRAKGMMLAVIPNRVAASIVSITFLSATSSSAPVAFVVFALLCAGVWVFLYRRCPETKGRSLEDMLALFQDDAAGGAAPRGKGLPVGSRARRGYYDLDSFDQMGAHECGPRDRAGRGVAEVGDSEEAGETGQAGGPACERDRAGGEAEDAPARAEV